MYRKILLKIVVKKVKIKRSERREAQKNKYVCILSKKKKIVSAIMLSDINNIGNIATECFLIADRTNHLK